MESVRAAAAPGDEGGEGGSGGSGDSGDSGSGGGGGGPRHVVLWSPESPYGTAWVHVRDW